MLNEEIANLLKEKINSSITCRDELGITFDYSGEVTGEDAELILGKITGLHSRALETAETAKSAQRVDSLRMFAANLEKAFSMASSRTSFSTTWSALWTMQSA